MPPRVLIMPATLLVTGAAGHLGQRVVAHLLDTYGIAPERIIAGTRNPAKLGQLTDRGIQARRLDFEDPASLVGALAGVDRMLLISTDAIDRPGRRLAQHKAVIESAGKSGVRHIVYTSMPNPDTSVVLFAPDHLGTEAALAASGLSHTILRNNWYMENLFMSLPAAFASGKWFTAAGDGRIPYISRDDCARAAAAALAADTSANSVYNISGPERLTTAAIAGVVTEISGKPIEVVQVNEQQLAGGLKAAGVPEFVIPLMLSIEANTRLGKLDLQTDDCERLTGKAPQKLRDFLVANRAALK